MQNKEDLKYSGFKELLILESLTNYNNSIVYDALKYSKNANKIIDFGAGIGTLSMIFRNKYKKHPLCIEIDQTNIKYIKKRDFNFLESIKDLSDSVDLIFSSNVIEHIEDDYQTINSFKKILKDNGTLFLYVPAKMILWTKLDEIVGHYRRYEISKLKKLVEKSGFKVEKIHYADFCGFLTTLLWKFFNKYQNRSLPSQFTLTFYDKFIFPISRILDNLGLKYLIGKNIVLLACKC